MERNGYILYDGLHMSACAHVTLFIDTRTRRRYRRNTHAGSYVQELSKSEFRQVYDAYKADAVARVPFPPDGWRPMPRRQAIA